MKSAFCVGGLWDNGQRPVKAWARIVVVSRVAMWSRPTGSKVLAKLLGRAAVPATAVGGGWGRVGFGGSKCLGCTPPQKHALEPKVADLAARNARQTCPSGGGCCFADSSFAPSAAAWTLTQTQKGRELQVQTARQTKLNSPGTRLLHFVVCFFIDRFFVLLCPCGHARKQHDTTTTRPQCHPLPNWLPAHASRAASVAVASC